MKLKLEFNADNTARLSLVITQEQIRGSPYSFDYYLGTLSAYDTLTVRNHYYQITGNHVQTCIIIRTINNDTTVYLQVGNTLVDLGGLDPLSVDNIRQIRNHF